MLKASDLWQFSLAIYSQPEVKDSCLMLQDRWQHNVNILLSCAYLDRIALKLSVADLEPMDQCISDTEVPLKHMRRLRKEAKFKEPQRYQALLSDELKLEKQQQQSIVECLNSLQLTSSNSDNLSLYSCWVSGQSLLHEQVEALQTIRMASASYSLLSTEN